jgi:hypothetical protein
MKLDPARWRVLADLLDPPVNLWHARVRRDLAELSASPR